jgi:Uri superfamily endonuclease
VEIVETVTSPRLECSVAADIDRGLSRITGFGCSDCHCPSHLHYSRDFDAMRRVVKQAHRV